MTVFTSADIPASVNTLEKLAVWVSQALSNLNQQTAVQELSGLNQPVAVAQIFEYDDGGQKKWRFVGRQSIELSPNWQTGATKLWANAQILSASALPTDFKS
jgi:hypothetical protein